MTKEFPAEECHDLTHILNDHSGCLIGVDSMDRKTGIKKTDWVYHSYEGKR